MNNIEIITDKIRFIRNQKVMLDFDLAVLYKVENKRLKEAVRRNSNRFPEDFMFELTEIEFNSLRTQNASSNRGEIRYMPFAFTEQGIAMLSSVLNSEKAIEVIFQSLEHLSLYDNSLYLTMNLKVELKKLKVNFPIFTKH